MASKRPQRPAGPPEREILDNRNDAAKLLRLAHKIATANPDMGDPDPLALATIAIGLLLLEMTGSAGLVVDTGPLEVDIVGGLTEG